MGKCHAFHRTVGEILVKWCSKHGEVILDSACGGTGHLPLFQTEEKSLSGQFCNVDALIIKDGRIEVIVEIEESNLKPIYICGKYLASAFSKFYIPSHSNGTAIPMGEKVLFVQIVDAGKLSRRTYKFDQLMKLEQLIQNILPAIGSKISSYRLLCINESSTEKGCPQLIDCINAHLFYRVA